MAASSSALGSMAGKLCVVTGANSGIGKEIAREFAREGARVVLACRSRERAASAAHDIVRDTGNDNVEVRELDLARVASVRAFAEGFNGPRERVHVLVNNAGAMFGARETTPDGFEATWQVNCLGPHLLARLMMPALARAAAAASHAPGAARYVFVGSRLEQRGDCVGELDRLRRDGTISETGRGDGRGGGGGGGDGGGGDRDGAEEGKNDEDEDEEAKFNTFAAYGTAKQAGTALTYEMVRRVEAAATSGGGGGGGGGSYRGGVVIHACTPGMVNTNLGRFVGPVLQTLAAPLQWALTKTSKQGAEVPLWLATSNSREVIGDGGDGGAGGGYFGTEGSFKSGPVIALQSSDASRDPAVGKRLWDACEEMHGEVDAPLV